MALPLFNKLQKTTPYVVIAAITAIYLGFLSRNQVGDAYWYAYLSLSGEQLFEPHHLLYCLLGNGIVRLFSFTGIEPILLLQATNALFAGGCLLILLHI